jgi:hypothetical protein
MQRRIFISTGLLATAFVSSSLAQQAPQGVTVLYVGGWDCSICKAWKSTSKAGWLASKEYAKVKYVEIDTPKLKDAYESRNWPKEYRAILDQLPAKFGTPRFIVIRDGKILANETGTAGWDPVAAKVRELVG